MFGRIDLAKYPFSAEAAEYVKSKGLTLEDLASQELRPILAKAEERVRGAILEGKIPEWRRGEEEIEILSYPIALILMSLIKDQGAQRRFALAEAKRAYGFLREDSPEKIRRIGEGTFGMRIRAAGDLRSDRFYEFELHFADYLRDTASLRHGKWKLCNRILSGGWVSLTREELARLIQEEVYRRILERLSTPLDGEPEFLKPILNGLRGLVESARGMAEYLEAPKGLIPEAMPPCIKSLYEGAVHGRNISHMGRFALTAFLAEVGLGEEDIIRIFQSSADFDGRKTKYQVEHIFGLRGSRTKYKPPKCDTMRTHGLCIGPEGECVGIKHPMAYYERKLGLRRIRRAKGAETVKAPPSPDRDG
ncbi:MAG: DNA primase large subunit PriL [Candidatus Bathyarchaeia archaeon]